MLTDKRIDPGSLTQTRWREVLLHFGQREWASRQHPLQRRGQPRHHMHAIAKLMFQSPDDQQPTVYANCPILDASASGLAVRNYLKIAAGTMVTLELSVGDRRLLLLGRVVKCTGFQGRFRIGFALDFTEKG